MVRPSRVLIVVASLAGAAVIASWLPVARADFSAEGRKKKGGAKGGPRPKVERRPREAGGDDGAAGKGPSVEVLIARYMGIALAQPTAQVPLQRLAQLHRDRDGNVKKLVEELERRAADPQAPERTNARLALAGVLRLDGRLDEAARAFEAVIVERPRDAQARLGLAQLLVDRGDRAGARKQYDEALGLLTQAVDREATLRSLRTLALEARDVEGARGYHQQLVKASGGALLVRAELGRELLARGDAARAEEELREVAKAAAGDNRALAPALLDLGRAQAAQKKNADALETLRRAQAIAGSEAGVRSEILNVTAEVFRADNDLRSLIATLERENAGDFARLSMLGGLYEETGQVERAIATYRRALGVNARNIELRVKVVRLLQAQGELDKAIAENERLIQAAPRNPEFVFQLCETLLQRGDRARALDLLAKLERSASNDEDVLARVADFYDRIDEKERATRLFARLTSIAPGDPAHLVDLGDRFWQAGDQKKALETWSRLRTAVPGKARALTALGEVLLEHDQVPEALAALREAVDLEPANLKLRRGLALALERAGTGQSMGAARTARFEEARAAWSELLAKAGADRLLAREARTHLVSLWALLKQLEPQVEPLRRKLGDDPPDLEAGRLLVEVQIKLRKLPEAEASLVRITSKAPGDAEAFLALERVRVLQHDLPGAIAALERLVEIDPRRAREFFQRMAQYAAELYRDDDAIRFSEKAVALAPNDADGHRKLGEMHRRRGNHDRAIQSFRQAIAINDRLHAVHMELADLLISRGEVDEADRLYRRVLRSAPDEELIAQAGRLSMQRNLVKGTLVDLENELLPLSLGHPGKRVYRRLLVELYGNLAFPLVQRVRFGTAAEAADARAQLGRIGARGVKPLLDALADEQASQVNTAIDILAFAANRGAAPTLASFATGAAELPLRVRAMVATGALREVSLLTRYEGLVAPRDGEAVAPGDPVTVAAAWAVARMGDKKALPLLERMLESGAPEVRAFGALGLGLAHERASASRLEGLARAADAAPLARAAAAVALGELGDRAVSPTLVALVAAPEPFVRSAALAALTRLGDPQVVALALPMLFADDEGERRAAAACLAQVAPANPAKPSPRSVDALDVPSGVIDAAGLVDSLLFPPTTASARATALVSFEADIAKAAALAASASVERAAHVADALLSSAEGAPSFSPFTDDLGALAPADRKRVEGAAASLRARLVPTFAALVRNPSPIVKIRAVRVLEGQVGDAAALGLVLALGDADPDVLRAALVAAQASPDPRPIAAVVRVLQTSSSWALRVLAASTLRAMAARHDQGALAAAFEGLEAAALNDSFALVREAALQGLVGARAPKAREITQKVAQSDPDPQIRALAASLASAP